MYYGLFVNFHSELPRDDTCSMAVSALKELSRHSKYVAAVVLAGVGDALGYKRGEWELQNSGPAIHEAVAALGGLSNISCKCKHSFSPLIKFMIFNTHCLS